MPMPHLRSTTHTLSVINIEDHEPRHAAVTYSDRRVLHYACDPGGGPVSHILDPAQPHLCRPVYAHLPDTDPPPILTCQDGDLGVRLLNGVDFLVADLYRWDAHRQKLPLLPYAVCIEREDDPDLRVPVIEIRGSTHLHAVAIARCHYPAIVGRTVAVWRHPGEDPRTASLLAA
ncbi:MAG: hypothetical protein OYH76_01685 [Defluviicoccus sp.]|nr:hypothetical protein [Defluviicoccus sp.]MDE0274576.1 hypothetical protein [Defluviicoccus sp.]